LFAQSRFVQAGIFNGEYMTRLLQEHVSGKANHDYRLWILMNLEVWYRMYFENENVESMKEYIKSSVTTV
jgi:asparagine synthase (glutamine-hydrolysing)